MGTTKKCQTVDVRKCLTHEELEWYHEIIKKYSVGTLSDIYKKM